VNARNFNPVFIRAGAKKIFQGVIGHFGLKAHTRVKDLSRGERAGLALGLTLAPDPELLVLDDPALGLTRSPAGRWSNR